jgi:cysteine desulfurase
MPFYIQFRHCKKEFGIQVDYVAVKANGDIDITDLVQFPRR